jgi:peptidoglycan/xylan/chitin deacetylase (PgdA/CDA1 family)
VTGSALRELPTPGARPETVWAGRPDIRSWPAPARLAPYPRSAMPATVRNQNQGHLAHTAARHHRASWPPACRNPGGVQLVWSRPAEALCRLLCGNSGQLRAESGRSITMGSRAALPRAHQPPHTVMTRSGTVLYITSEREVLTVPSDVLAVPVLMYHSVTDHGNESSLWTVRLERFEQQMNWLRRRGRKGVSMREIMQAVAKGDGANLVGLTFDDGYADFAEYVLPVLERYGFSATAFVLAGRLGGDNGWAAEPRKDLMTAEQVRRMAAAGMEIGSHGLRHVRLAAADATELESEVAESRRILREVSDQEVTGFCYPYGNHDGRVVGAVQAAGYSYACADSLSDFTGKYAVPRIYVGDTDTTGRLWMKGMRHWLRWQYRGPGAAYLEKLSGLRSRMHSS